MSDEILSKYLSDLVAPQNKHIPAEICSSGKLIERIDEVSDLIDIVGCGGRIWTYDVQVMSLASYLLKNGFSNTWNLHLPFFDSITSILSLSNPYFWNTKLLNLSI